VRRLELGESGDVSVTAQCKNNSGRWVAVSRAAEGDPMEGSRLRARPDGVRQEIVRLGRTRHEAEAALEAAVAAVLHGTDAVLSRGMPLLKAGEYRLQQIARPDSGLSARTTR
jgi:hypothetical protein